MDAEKEDEGPPFISFYSDSYCIVNRQKTSAVLKRLTSGLTSSEMSIPFSRVSPDDSHHRARSLLIHGLDQGPPTAERGEKDEK